MLSGHTPSCSLSRGLDNGWRADELVGGGGETPLNVAEVCIF